MSRVSSGLKGSFMVSLPRMISGARAGPYPDRLSFNEVIRSYASSIGSRSRFPRFTCETRRAERLRRGAVATGVKKQVITCLERVRRGEPRRGHARHRRSLEVVRDHDPVEAELVAQQPWTIAGRTPPASSLPDSDSSRLRPSPWRPRPRSHPGTARGPPGGPRSSRRCSPAAHRWSGSPGPGRGSASPWREPRRPGVPPRMRHRRRRPPRGRRRTSGRRSSRPFEAAPRRREPARGRRSRRARSGTRRSSRPPVSRHPHPRRRRAGAPRSPAARPPAASAPSWSIITSSGGFPPRSPPAEAARPRTARPEGPPLDDHAADLSLPHRLTSSGSGSPLPS